MTARKTTAEEYSENLYRCRIAEVLAKYGIELSGAPLEALTMAMMRLARGKQ